MNMKTSEYSTRYVSIIEYKPRQIGGTWKRVDLAHIKAPIVSFEDYLNLMDTFKTENPQFEYRIKIYHARPLGH